MKLDYLVAREILDSRGNPTVEVEMHCNGKIEIASAPSGASTGSFEAIELRDDEKARYHGKGVRNVVNMINGKVRKSILSQEFNSLREFDEFLIKLDGTENKSNLGANATTALSVCFAKIYAVVNNMQLYEYINKEFHKNVYKIPVPFANILNGGKHAGNNLAIQEFMIVPLTEKYSEAMQAVSEIYHELKGILKNKYGSQAINVGDEGGFAPNLNNCEEAIELITQAIQNLGYQKNVRISLDAAASSFYEKKAYKIDGKSLSADNLLDYYVELVKKYKLFSIEDPFNEDDFESFAKLLKEVKGKCRIVGDDLTVTNKKRVEQAVKQKSIDTLLLKVNQIGTVSEAFDAAHMILSAKGQVIVSHRSGETEDNWLADLATGMHALGIKLGAPARGERTAKYNRLLRIETKNRLIKYIGHYI
ncbi:MAG: phosphopyruvate hydratase [Candidatus Micrarchaeota archaeon]|nr:phosphopyruvate hydratase [Candidatus Micrarchaeota archaeon]